MHNACSKCLSDWNPVSHPHNRLEPNLPLFFTDFAFWQCSKFLPILPEIMPVFTYFARNYASTCLPILLVKLNVNKNRSNNHCTLA